MWVLIHRPPSLVTVTTLSSGGWDSCRLVTTALSWWGFSPLAANTTSPATPALWQLWWDTEPIIRHDVLLWTSPYANCPAPSWIGSWGFYSILNPQAHLASWHRHQHTPSHTHTDTHTLSLWPPRQITSYSGGKVLGAIGWSDQPHLISLHRTAKSLTMIGPKGSYNLKTWLNLIHGWMQISRAQTETDSSQTLCDLRFNTNA